VDVHKGSRRIMKDLIPYVNHVLEQKADLVGSVGAKLTTLGPLELPTTNATNQSVNFKEPWVPANFKMSVAVSSMYEACGCLFWVDPEATTGPPFHDAGRAGEGPGSAPGIVRGYGCEPIVHRLAAVATWSTPDRSSAHPFVGGSVLR
jgi:hypothetical protein